MPDPRTSAEAAAARLAQALSAQDDLSHEQAERLIPGLVAAERAGEDVDGDPAFAALLRHLDRCADCLSRYEQLADDLAAVMGEGEPLPQVTPPSPGFFPEPVRKGDHLLLEVMRGALRRFSLTFDLPRLAPSLATLSGQRPIYADSLTEVEGAPLLALTVGREAGAAWLQVAIRQLGRPTRWRLMLDVGGQTVTATTDERGMARITLSPDLALGEVRLHCEELPVEAEDQ